MEFLTSNVQVWHLIVAMAIVIVSTTTAVINKVYDKFISKSEYNDYEECVTLSEFDELRSELGELSYEVNKPRPVSSAPYYDEIHRLEKQVKHLTESRWQYKLARWLGAI